MITGETKQSKERVDTDIRGMLMEGQG